VPVYPSLSVSLRLSAINAFNIPLYFPRKL